MAKVLSEKAGFFPLSPWSLLPNLPPNSHLQQTLPTSKITLRAPISPPYETPPDKSPPDDHRTTTRRSFCSHHRTNPLKSC
ncbi:hypothetical protein HanRHA438_Chr12g0563161 [Helianthus annuus]|uniref:Uncharacterized protein n=1 Tax=Helianthus annuus TaxID=4232 RepID=A0A9K3HI59_HELAN|nr:hypothetical protein HanXRQr2_Chr12g0551831 [Helianthus annuus]KAJ0863539.1 hypothetical protein HanPSC8_Chr12g0531251 [Helianthus annuus]KAJ0867434.1 hypothetical protein HanRHA438_Chr12g0563161 [Helianthus annuus]